METRARHHTENPDASFSPALDRDNQNAARNSGGDVMSSGSLRADRAALCGPQGMRLLRSLVAVLGIAVGVFACLSDVLVGGEPGFGPLQALALAGGVGCVVVSCLPARAFKLLLLLAASSSVALLLAEIGLQAFWSAHLTTIYRYHSDYLLELIPGSERRFTRLPANGGQTYRVHTNRSGFRGEELNRPRPGKRVVVYGDSFIEAEFSALESTYVHRLGKRLSAGFELPVEMVNAGVIGYGPDQVSLRMDMELGLLDPDLIVVGLFADNDFGDLLRNKLFSLDASGKLRPHRFALSRSLRRAFWQAKYSPVVFRLLTKFIAAVTVRPVTPMEQVARDLALSIEEYREFVIEGNREVSHLLNDHYDADISLTPDSDSARYKVRFMEAMIERIDETARHYGVPLLLLIIPSPIDVCEDYDGAQVDTRKYPGYRRPTLTTIIEESALRHAIPHINLFPPFRARNANELYFHGGDNHWNDAGQELAAELTANYVLSQRLVR